MVICDCGDVYLLFCGVVRAKWRPGPMCYLPLPVAVHVRSSTSNSGFALLLRSFHISYFECVRAVFWHRSELHIGLRALCFLD